MYVPPVVNLGGDPSSDGPGSVTTPQCRDRRDNDGDGKVDYPDDPGCVDSNDNSEQDVSECIPEWSCTIWSNCVSGTQVRVCTPENNCDYAGVNPGEEEECGALVSGEENEVANVGEQIANTAKKLFGKLTFMVIGFTIGIVVIVLVIILVVLKRRERLENRKGLIGRMAGDGKEVVYGGGLR